MKILTLNCWPAFIFFLCFFLTASYPVYADPQQPKLFLFFDPTFESKLEHYKNILVNPSVSGAQVVYTWNELEPKKGVYDFSKIKKDLLFLNGIHKQLFIQLQDRSFKPNVFYVPDYIRFDKTYQGGVAMQHDFPGEGKPITIGWVARTWDPAVRVRFQLLIKKLAEQFNGKIYGINLPETAADFDITQPPMTFTPDKYFYAELENMAVLRIEFKKSVVIQYVNFFPGEWNNDHNYMQRLFSYAMKHHIGLGGPDVVPYRKSQMKNSYPFFYKYKSKINVVGMAIQAPDYSYINSETGRPYSFSEFYLFATNYLGASILFWNVQEPFFSNELVPKLNKRYFNAG